MKKNPGYTTRSLHTPFSRRDVHNSLHFPVYENVAFEFDTAAEMADAFQDRKKAHAYSRVTNPTVEYLEEKVKNITGAQAVIALSSGMAAIASTFMSVCLPGENIISSPRLFAHTYGLFADTLARLGIETRFVNMLDEEEMVKSIDGNTRAVFFETVTNPQLEIANIESIARLCKTHGVLLITDSTITPFNVFDSGSLGVNIEVLSSTKFISGGATSVGGMVVDNGNTDWNNIPALRSWSDRYADNALLAKMRKEVFRTLGPTMSPHTAWMQNLGLDIMDLRVERAYKNCLEISKFLSGKTGIKEVNYPGLETNNFYDLALKQFKGIPGTVMSFDLESEEQCYKFMDKLKVIRRATNLNDNKTLIIHPWSTIYSDYSTEQKLKWGLRDTMLRLSVGIEDFEDLLEDLDA